MIFLQETVSEPPNCVIFIGMQSYRTKCVYFSTSFTDLHTRFSLRRAEGAAVKGRLQMPHDFQQFVCDSSSTGSTLRRL